jgi:Lrp/AsnC family leucine-responsive transcriptional regulator
MASDPTPVSLDDVDRSILAELQADGRLPFSELGRRVGLSAPAVTERVRRLEAAEVITGYRALVRPSALGLSIEAIIRVADHTSRLRTVLDDLVEVVDAKHATGDDCWVLRVLVADMGELEEVVGRLGRFGATTTSLVFSTPVDNRPITPPS